MALRAFLIAPPRPAADVEHRHAAGLMDDLTAAGREWLRGRLATVASPFGGATLT